MSDINFSGIAPRCGGKREAFEELCCQIARHSSLAEAKFIRLRGAGGDGGVECFAESPDGTKVGWQAKYVFEFDALLKQVSDSLATALKIHESLIRYVVCFPFDLTGPTGRRGKSEFEKFEAWREGEETAAKTQGRTLTIEPWSTSHIQSELLEMDVAGGVREYFFNQTILSADWFSEQITSATRAAGPRYTQELSVETDLWKWFEALVRSSGWSDVLNEHVRKCQKHCDELVDAVGRTDSDAHSMSPAWPKNSRDDANESIAKLSAVLETCAALPKTFGTNEPTRVLEDLRDSIVNLREIEARLASDLEEKHGKGRADSPGFRQFMAEYECSFPAANLDHLRDAISAIDGLARWLRSPNGWLAFEPVFIMTGIAGSGKTHGVCDLANRRLEDGHLTCVCYGHEFRGEPEPWTRFREVLGLPATLSRDGVLDCLNAAAEASGEPLILIIDAVNETKPLRYWRERIAAFCDAVERRPNLRLCFTCRTSFATHCLPEGNSIFVADHRGFEGIERDACQAFFEYYGLEPPITPILQPELANPLYLRLVCETARSQGLRHLPTGWLALSTAIKSFLDEKEKQFSVEYETSSGAAVVSGSLLAMARELARSGESSIRWSKAEEVISTDKPVARDLSVLAWLVRSDLVIEDAPHSACGLDSESTVRPSFERLGDFLIANELLSNVEADEIHAAFQTGGDLNSLFADSEVVTEHNGVISALSILLPENIAPGTELTSYLEYGAVRSEVLPIVVDSFSSRDPSSFSFSSIHLVKELLASSQAFKGMDAVVAISWRPSELDAFWLDSLLKEKPLAERDTFWCGWLHDRYEHHGAVRRLIDAAFELPLDRLDAEIAERWTIALFWFTAAADRRVKDFATRAIIAVLHARPEIAPSVMGRMMKTDDGAVRERVLLAIYGVMLQTRNAGVLPDVCRWLCERLETRPRDFDNALIRDHARCLCELADHLGILPDECDVDTFSRPMESEWPLVLPCDKDVKRWEELPKLEYSCLHDDFFRYTMSCLHGWEDAVARVDMGRWILRHIAEDLGYEDSGCGRYDNYMLGNYGQGRAKPVWAERIGKKYQWVAMFRLAARLADHAERKRAPWNPEPDDRALILSDERQLDPTLPSRITGDKEGSAWWIRAQVELDRFNTLSDEDWVSLEEDVPRLDQFLGPFDHEGQRWRLLDSYLSWDNRPPDAAYFDTIYRNIWIHVRGYLVKRRNAKVAFDCLVERNLLGGWMPEGGSGGHGFMGEYPWGTTFKVEPDEYFGRSGSYDLPCKFIPVSIQVPSEWEYDATLPHNLYIQVPARTLFAAGDLWWNTRDGFGIPGGRTLFQDPSVTESGPGALIADADDLWNRLDHGGYQLIWTLLGEKLIVGEPRRESRPYRTFSQVARLHKSGRLQTSELSFFEKYDESVGPVGT